MSANNGGPAFPLDAQTARAWAVFENAKKPLPETDYVRLIESLQTGMTLRDYFAAKAMQGLIFRTHMWQDHEDDEIAGCAYALADAMLKERDK